MDEGAVADAVGQLLQVCGVGVSIATGHQFDGCAGFHASCDLVTRISGGAGRKVARKNERDLAFDPALRDKGNGYARRRSVDSVTVYYAARWFSVGRCHC